MAKTKTTNQTKPTNGDAPAQVSARGIDQTNPEQVAELFQKIGDLEKDFADVEIDACMCFCLVPFLTCRSEHCCILTYPMEWLYAMRCEVKKHSACTNILFPLVRRKEHALKPLYETRTALLSQIPQFWSIVFLNAPEEIQQVYDPADIGVLSAITNFNVERYGITSAEKGEPRSLRFTFEFGENQFIEDKLVTKEFEYSERGLVSRSVGLKWKKGRDLTSGVLGRAVELEAAEAALGVKEVEDAEREGLWQYEKLRERLEIVDEEDDGRAMGSFWSWLGYRGPVRERKEKAKKEVNGQGGDESEDEDEDEDDGMLDVEIYPNGEEVAIMMAEDLWPNVMDTFSEFLSTSPCQS